MYFDSLSAAMTMGGHGGYVWSAYAITFLVLGVVILRPILSARRLRRDIRSELARKATVSGVSNAS
ncbi:MAG: heme exporter protein CcmD [Cellvibrionales bacterium TMED21]|nr:heme exporter protein CcmD [Halieaceae bacterium]OUT67314.1 MAG: heme exporter protein CcmD [Cellvibrionales bacterium TMED21]